jgi:hypothetical protein
MPMRLGCVALIALAALSGCGEVAGTAKLSEAASSAKRPGGKPERTCRAVTALATGFGEQNVTGLADGNLTAAIDKAKDEMAADGAKGFSVSGRAVKCEGYIDFGGAVGREHKCHASAQLCGNKG